MNKTLKKVGCIALGAVLLGGAYASGNLMHKPVIVEKQVEVPVVTEKVVEVAKEVKVEVPVNVEVEDLSFVAIACDRLHYDIVAECKEEVKAEDAALKLAFAQIESDFAQELKDEKLVAKTKYAELVKVYDKFKDVEVTESDFDAGDYTFEIKAKIKDTNKEEKFNVLFTVDVKDGEAEVKDVELI